MSDRDQREGPAPHEITAIELLWENVWVRGVVYVLVAAFVVYLLITQQQAYTFALQVGLIGFLIAYVLNPLVVALTKVRVGRGLAVVLVYLLLLQLLVFGSALLTQVVAETARFINLVPAALEELGGVFSRLSVWWSGFTEALPEFVQERFGLEADDTDLADLAREQMAAWITALAQSLNRFLERVVSEGPTVLVAGATSLISATFQVVLIAIASAYFLYDFPRITANMRRFVPVRWRPLYGDLAQKADRAVGGFLRGQILITIILGFMIWIGLTLSGVPLATAISFLAAVFNLVPYLGPIVGTIPAVLLGLTVSPLTALLALLVFIVANQIEAHVLAPLILAKSTDIHPVTVLISIMIGIGMMGILGAFVAVPIAALIKVILEEYLLSRPPYTGDEAEAAAATAGPSPPPGTDQGPR